MLHISILIEGTLGAAAARPGVNVKIDILSSLMYSGLLNGSARGQQGPTVTHIQHTPLKLPETCFQAASVYTIGRTVLGVMPVTH